MIGYSQKEVFTEDHLKAMGLAKGIVDALPDGPWRCHEVARVVERMLKPLLLFKIRLVDGKYLFSEHTWLQLGSASEGIILDVYAVGSLPQVQLVHLWLGNRDHWVEGMCRSDIDESLVENFFTPPVRVETFEDSFTFGSAPQDAAMDVCSVADGLSAANVKADAEET